MFLCPPKIGFVQGSTSVVCCVNYIFSSVESNKEVFENSHTSKHGDVKIYKHTDTCKDSILIVVYFAKLLLNCIT